MSIVLNEKQQEAVNYIEGPLLIMAGAGAGKTKTITERIVHIIQKGVTPSSILAVTFTNKAAKEMRERVMLRLEEEHIVSALNPYEEKPLIKTFHSLGLFILGEQYTHAGLLRHPTILDQSDTLAIVKSALTMLGIDPKMHDPSKIRSIISLEKGNFVSSQAYKAKVATAQMDVIASVWRIYEEELRKQKALDFDDLIVRAVTLLKDNEMIRTYYQKRFFYVHIDEYQDTNAAQYEFVKLLVNPLHNNICVVGDTDQNIYSWRGANLKNIMNFENDFADSHLILLEQNYRSTQHILTLANTSIAKNKVRKEKNLFTKEKEGEKITVQATYNEIAEGAYIGETIQTLISYGVLPESIAILYRANFQSRVIEEAMLAQSIPYNMLGTKFFERKEIKDVMSYIRASLNQNSQQDLKRVFDTPKKGIGKTTVAKLFAGEDMSKSAGNKIQDVFTFLKKIKETLEHAPLSEVIHMILLESGLEKELSLGGSDDIERLENIRELVTVTQKYDDKYGVEIVDQFLEEVSLQSDQDNDKKENKGVRLMTIHASKGLEFDYVFIIGLEHDLFPHKNMGGRNKSKEEEEEERRLFYVAVTRARKKLFLTHAEIRTIYGQKQICAPSVFLDDVDADIAEIHDVYFGNIEKSISYW